MAVPLDETPRMAASKISSTDPRSSRIVSIFSHHVPQEFHVGFVIGSKMVYHHITALSVSVEAAVSLLQPAGIPRTS
jgi:hypothetical protein